MGLERRHGKSEAMVYVYVWCCGVWHWRKEGFFFLGFANFLLIFYYLVLILSSFGL